MYDYEHYLKSPHWVQFRADYFERHSLRCELCGEDRQTIRYNLHHRNYDNLEAEQDVDVLILCRQCHKELHDLEIFHSISLMEAEELLRQYIQEDEEFDGILDDL